jgi:hypothetical protein
MHCILIGGTSHVGKSTLAEAWGAELGWPVISTDRLGRHPGRPWPVGGGAVPPHVAEHYTRLADGELLEANLAHYRNMWPLIATLVGAHAAAPLGRLMIEGSGCWPDEVRTLSPGGVAAIWLVATDELIERRIRRESGYEEADQAARRLIGRFITRSQLYNRRLLERLQALGLPSVAVAEQEDTTHFIARCRERLLRL